MFSLTSGAIVDSEEAVSAVRLAVEYVNEMGLIGPSHTLSYIANTTQAIATTEGIQLGMCTLCLTL